MTILLGVNIDHVATLRQARGTNYPDPVQAAIEAEQAGADGITMHLREDRRHIQDRDFFILKDIVQTKINMEMAATDEMVEIATKLRATSVNQSTSKQPEDCCLVPEKREELTTEGGLDVAGNLVRIKECCSKLADSGIKVSLFIEPEPRQLDAALEAGAPVVELHTGHYADCHGEEQQQELVRIGSAVEYGLQAGLQVNAGHGLHYHNVQPIVNLTGITELNVGHSIISRALFTGLQAAVKEMKALMVNS